ncbi:MAG: bile acid:sodium symporter family protein [Chloroflexota bacterium]
MELTPTQEALVNVIIPIAVLIIMFSMGLSLRWEDFKRVLTEPRSFLIAMLGQYLLIPGLVILLSRILNVSPEIALGALIVAAIPGGIISNGFVYMGRGNSALSVSLTGISQIIGLFSIPFWISWGLSTYYAEVANVDFPVGQSLIVIFVINVVPMIFGMLTLRFAPKFAERAEPFLRRLSLLMLFTIVVVAVLPNFAVAREQGFTVLLMAILVCGGGMAIGQLVSRGAGLDAKAAFTNGMEIGMQNLSTAILIAITILGRSELAIYTAVYSVVSPLIATLAVMIYNRWQKEPEGPVLA